MPKAMSDTQKAGAASGKAKAPTAEKPAKKEAKASKPAKKAK
jgi:hypothetical protein